MDEKIKAAINEAFSLNYDIGMNMVEKFGEWCRADELAKVNEALENGNSEMREKADNLYKELTEGA